MRGNKYGLKIILRENQPNLLDIDGHKCHHVQNAVKKFCSPFRNFVEKLADDLNRLKVKSRFTQTYTGNAYDLKHAIQKTSQKNFTLVAFRT